MSRIKLLVAYDGTNYCGWQVQKNGVTIEEVLNKKLTKLLGEEIVVIGASRTDSGVHAVGNVAIFDTITKIPPEKVAFAINKSLPEDIRVIESMKVNDDFHPRFCKSIKTYEYKIYNSKIPCPIRRLYSNFIYSKLDIEKMKEAAEYLKGEHDFKSFCSIKTKVENTVRTITNIEIFTEFDKELVYKSNETYNDITDKKMITIKISGNGFLYNMVRIIAGTLIRVGTGMYEPEYIKSILEARDRQMAGPKAQACGLTLIGIEYL